MIVLLSALSCYLAGTVASIALPGRIGRTAGFLLLGAGGFASCYLAVNQLVVTPLEFGNAALHAVLRVDGTAAVFIGIIAIVSVLVALFGLGPLTKDERGNGRTASATANAIAFASLLCCCAGDVLLFIFAWELLALTFFWAVAYAGTDSDSPTAAYVTITITHVAGACIVAALLVLAHHAGSFAVGAVVSGGRDVAVATRGAILVLLLIGFGAKFGVLPMQLWMPYGYRAAPSIVAALMAGGALNVGFYGVVRFIVSFPNPPMWFAVLVIVLGAISAFLGISLAAIQRDMRRLAAYSSMENGGIILAAFGIAIAGRALHLDMLVGLGVATAYVQIIAHALGKSTLFLAISSVSSACSTASIDRLGGLARLLPITTIAFLLCGMSLAALPPTVGFVSEWLVLESFMQAFRTGSITLEVVFAIAGALIGITAGVTIVAITKLLGTGLLGAPRSAEAATARETRSPWQLAALIVGSLSVLGGGLFAAAILRRLGPASIDAVAHAPATAAIIGTIPLIQPAFAGFSSISGLGLAFVIGGFTLVFWLVTRCFSRPKGTRVTVWTSGEQYRPWTQYTGTGYAHPAQVILNAKERLGLPFYRAVFSGVVRITAPIRATQSGVIAAYLSYILVFTILLLALYPSIRHW